MNGVYVENWRGWGGGGRGQCFRSVCKSWHMRFDALIVQSVWEYCRAKRLTLHRSKGVWCMYTHTQRMYAHHTHTSTCGRIASRIIYCCYTMPCKALLCCFVACCVGPHPSLPPPSFGLRRVSPGDGVKNGVADFRGASHWACKCLRLCNSLANLKVLRHWRDSVSEAFSVVFFRSKLDIVRGVCPCEGRFSWTDFLFPCKKKIPALLQFQTCCYFFLFSCSTHH